MLADIAAVFGFAAPSGLAALGLAAALGGLVRGFTGFGFALVFVPIATIVVGPVAAVGLIWTIDIPFAWVLAASSWRRVQWRELLPLLFSALALLPAGAFVLTHADPKLARWAIVGVILLGVAALANGWRYQGRPGLPLSLGVGSTAGLVSGLGQIGGLPIAIFWLAAQGGNARQTRDNLNGFFCLLPSFAGLVYIATGIVDTRILLQALPLFLPYGLGLLLGSTLFPLASERVFRRIAYAVIAAAAIVALPALDGPLGR